MNQLYAEAGVKRKENAMTMGLRVLMIFGIILGIFLIFLGQLFAMVGIILLVGMFYLFPKLNVEYEYIFVDGQLDFDKIIGKAKRKTMLRIDFDQVEIMAPANSHALDTYTYVKLLVKDFSSGNKDSKPYVIVANVEEKKLKILFEPNETMLSAIKQKSPRKLSAY